MEVLLLELRIYTIVERLCKEKSEKYSLKLRKNRDGILKPQGVHKDASVSFTSTHASGSNCLQRSL